MVRTDTKPFKREKAIPPKRANLLSSDYSRHIPNQWKFLEGEPNIVYLISHEYARMWRKEHEEYFAKVNPPEKELKKDMIGKNFRAAKHWKPKKIDKKQGKPFMMKKFAKVKPSTSSRREPDDKAMRSKKVKKLNTPKKPAHS